MIKPTPKTGAGIAAIRKDIERFMWPEQDIPDVVEWLYNLRKQAMQERLGSWGMYIDATRADFSVRLSGMQSIHEWVG